MNIKDLIEAVKFQVSVKPQDEFMAEVAEGLETLYEENNRQKAEIDKLTCDYGCYKVSATDVVEQLKAEIEALIAGQETLQKYIAEKDAEIERLEANLKEAFEEIESLKQINLHCKSEAVKEFAERLKPLVDDGYVVDIIDNLVKEMVGEI